jgi:hypothetical protein
MSDFEKYLAALAALGLPAGTPIKAVRRKFRQMMRDVHPDLHPGDKAKEAAAKTINDAMNTLDAMSRDGRSQMFSTMAERRRRTGHSDSIRALGAPPLLVVRLIMAPAGAGKTRAWVRSVADARKSGERLHIILASPTIDLTDQTARELAKNGVRAPVTYVVHSQVAGGNSVAVMMRTYFQATAAEQDAVLLCTHAAVVDTPLPPDPERWDLTFDEMPDFVTFLSIDAPITHVHLTANVLPEAIDDRLYHLKPSEDNSALERLSRIANNRPHDGGLVHLQDLARALIHGHIVFVPISQWIELFQSRRYRHAGHLDALIVVPPTWFRQYRSVTMMGARCTTHLTALIWRKIWGVEFREDSDFDLPRMHTRQQADRLTIRWLFEERATRAFLSRKALIGGTLFSGACCAVARYYAGREYLWSAPQPGDDKEHGVADNFWRRLELEPADAFDPNLRLPGRTHGLNRERFLQTCNVALLQVINLTPQQYELLYQFGLTNEEIDKALAFDVAYQDMTRCNIRISDGTHDVDVTVLDQRTALELAESFAGCRVLRYPDDLIPSGLPQSNRRGPAPSGSAMTSTQRSRAYRARQAALRAQRQERKRES